MQDFGGATAATIATLPAFALGFFAGPSFGRVTRKTGADTITLEAAYDIADALSGPRRARRKRSSTRPSNSENNDLWLILGAAVVAVLLYMQFRLAIILALMVIATSISIVTVGVLLVMSRRRIIARSWGRTFAFLVPVAFTPAGIAVTVLLWDPPAGGVEFRRFLAEFARTHTLGGNLSMMEFVLYQLVGALFFTLVAMTSIALSLSTLCAVYVARDAWGQPMWQFLHRNLPGPTTWWSFAGLSAITAIAVLFTGGWVYEWLIHQNPPPGGGT